MDSPEEAVQGLVAQGVVLDDCISLMGRFPPNSVDLLLTDIPYDILNEVAQKNLGGLRKIHKGHADVITFDLEEFLRECSRITRGTIVIFCSDKQLSQIVEFFKTIKKFPTRFCAWHKTNPSPLNCKSMPVSALELFVWAKKPGAPYYAGYMHNLVESSCGKSKIFPTEKPLEIFSKIIEACTKEGDLVVDPCCGSGTTAVAAALLGRRFVVGDSSPESIRVTRERISKETKIV